MEYQINGGSSTKYVGVVTAQTSKATKRSTATVKFWCSKSGSKESKTSTSRENEFARRPVGVTSKKSVTDAPATERSAELKRLWEQRCAQAMNIELRASAIATTKALMQAAAGRPQSLATRPAGDSSGSGAETTADQKASQESTPTRDASVSTNNMNMQKTGHELERRLPPDQPKYCRTAFHFKVPTCRFSSSFSRTLDLRAAGVEGQSSSPFAATSTTSISIAPSPLSFLSRSMRTGIFTSPASAKRKRPRSITYTASACSRTA
mmetsp:Transcript_98360/g.283865  ORF Transcript_98360/g.283865 Transcript_98360/m.283865 type:complete len:265 (-) Transcript_98360:281-1075(-)